MKYLIRPGLLDITGVAGETDGEMRVAARHADARTASPRIEFHPASTMLRLDYPESLQLSD